jgi:hypothetical protein
MEKYGNIPFYGLIFVIHLWNLTSPLGYLVSDIKYKIRNNSQTISGLFKIPNNAVT